MVVKDMDIPSWDLYELIGNRKGVWSVAVRQNWKITFRFENGECEFGGLSLMSMRSKNRKPTHPGAILREDVLPSLNITQTELADRLGVSRRSVS